MTLAIVPNDIVWTRTGDPIRVNSTDPKTGKIILDPNFNTVQDIGVLGIKNGLDPIEKPAFKTSLTGIENEDKKQEIRDLLNHIEDLRAQNAEPRVIKYLENELQYRIVREKFAPENFSVEPITLGI